jgi:thiol-disulfide isomerase/thioredoxin
MKYYIIIILLSCGLSNRLIAGNMLSNVGKTVTFEVTLDSSINYCPSIQVYPNNIGSLNAEMADGVIYQPEKVNTSVYVFKLPVQNKPLYFSLYYTDSKGFAYILKHRKFEPGDKIKIMVKRKKWDREYDLLFSGLGSAKYTCYEECKNVVSRELTKLRAEPNVPGEDANFKMVVRTVTEQLNCIEKYRSRLSLYSYHLLKAVVICNRTLNIATNLNSNSESFKKTAAWNAVALSNIPDSVLYTCLEYLNYQLFRCKSSTMNNGTSNLPAIFYCIKTLTDHTLRDKVLAVFFINSWSNLGDSFEVLQTDAATFVKDAEAKSVIARYGNNRIGIKAYNFSLKDSTGNTVTFDQFANKVVFIDFWFTGCTFCKYYYQNVLRDVEKKYEKNRDVVFITVSIDVNKERWLKSLASGAYTSSDAVNLYTNGLGENDPLIKFYNITSYPKPMLIDKKGKIIKFSGREMREKDSLIAEIEEALGK